jgi:hypothetical protein
MACDLRGKNKLAAAGFYLKIGVIWFFAPFVE